MVVAKLPSGEASMAKFPESQAPLIGCMVSSKTDWHLVKDYLGWLILGLRASDKKHSNQQQQLNITNLTEPSVDAVTTRHFSSSQNRLTILAEWARQQICCFTCCKKYKLTLAVFICTIKSEFLALEQGTVARFRHS